MHPLNRLTLTCCVLCGLCTGAIRAVRAQGEGGEGHLIPIGGGYSDTYPGLVEAIVAQARGDTIRILVIPTSYATNALSITDAERQTNLTDAEVRRGEIEGACQRAAPAGVTCRAEILPVFVRADAEAPESLAFFAAPLDALFFLGGDQTVAMAALNNTPVEAALTDAYRRGALASGTSAGCSMQSAALTTGYNPNYADANALDFGAVDVWNTPERHGLPFGIQDAILDQHFFQRGRFGRLLTTIALPGAPHVGIGVDAYTGVHIYGGRQVADVFGLYTVAILDAETYQAAAGVRYGGPRHTLSLRNVLVTLLAPGDFSYDVQTRAPSLGAPAPQVEREFAALRLPAGAGPLLLGGNLLAAPEESAPLARFVALAGGAQAKLLIVADGYPSESSAERNAAALAAALGVPADAQIIPRQGAAPLTLAADYTGILITGKDQSQMHPELLGAVQAAWRAGAVILADDAAAAILGDTYAAHPPNAKADDEELAVQKSFWQGKTTLQPGLGWLDVAIEPQMLRDNRWGRFFSLAYARPERLTLGVTDGTALEIGPTGATVVGDNVIFALDLRTAKLALGARNGFVIANGLLDVFAPGDAVTPEVADSAVIPEVAPTPVLTSPAPTATPVPPTPTESPAPPSAPSAGRLIALALTGVVGVGLVGRYWRRPRTKRKTP